MKRACALFSVLLYFCFYSTFGFHYFNWLQEREYDKAIRPYYNVSPVNVTVQVYIHSVGPLNEQDFTFRVGVYLRQWWTDPRLINITSSKLSATNLEHLIWIPDTSVFDAFVQEGFKNSIRTVIKSNGEVYVSKRLKVTIPCEMDLNRYPMDTQICPLTLENYAFMTNDIDIYWHKNAITTKKKLILDGYDLVGVNSKTTMVGSLIGNETQYFKLLHSLFEVKRSVNYHIYRSFIPSILLIAFAIGSFWVPDTAVPARMGMIVTSFLASIFILQGVSAGIVKVNYTTPMQIFLLVNIVLIVSSLLEYLMVLHLRSKQTTKKQRSDNIILENHIMSKNVNDIEKSKEAISEEMSQNASSISSMAIQPKQITDSVHYIDKIARVISLVGYSLFCGIFFGYYMNN